MIYLSLNSGNGSLDLGLQRLQHWRVACYVEENDFNISLLEARIDETTLQDAPIWGNFFTFDGKPWSGLVDCIVGIESLRHSANHWKCASACSNKLVALIQDMEPRYILWQFAHASKKKIFRSASYLANRLEIFNYNTTLFKVRASDLGADHRRSTIFLCAEMADSTPIQRHSRIDEIEYRLSTPCRASRWTSNGRVYRGINGFADRMESINAAGSGTIPAMGAAISTLFESGIVF
jgi:hypothetical protein